MITLAATISGVYAAPELAAFAAIAAIWTLCYFASDDSEWEDPEL